MYDPTTAVGYAPPRLSPDDYKTVSLLDAVMYAVLSGSVRRLQWLTGVGMYDVPITQVCTKQGGTMLHVVATSINIEANVDMVRYLLNQEGMNVDQRDKYGRTALSCLWYSDTCNHIVDLFLVHGAHPDVPSDSGVTLLMRAASKGALQLVCMLINDHDADTQLCCDAGLNAFMYAVGQTHVYVIEWMLNNCPDTVQCSLIEDHPQWERWSDASTCVVLLHQQLYPSAQMYSKLRIPMVELHCNGSVSETNSRMERVMDAAQWSTEQLDRMNSSLPLRMNHNLKCVISAYIQTVVNVVLDHATWSTQ
jgi:hypothetical protein